MNEYTSWERPVQHPANILQETLGALGDGGVVAPLTLTADLSAPLHLYVFSPQTKGGHYPQVLTTVLTIDKYGALTSR